MTQYTAWRLVRPLQRLDYGGILASASAGKYHNAGDRVVYAWSSSEMAFLSLADLAGSSQPSELIRERLALPLTPGKIVTLAECITSGLFKPDALIPTRNWSRLVKQHGLLGMWVESELMPSESVLILNPDDAEFSSIAVTGTRMVASRVAETEAVPRFLS